MDLDEVRAFLAVVERGSLLAASEATGVSRTTLRRRIEALERELEAPLFLRTSGGLEPTRQALRLVAPAQEVLHNARRLHEAVAQGDEPAGLLRVLAPVGLPPAATARFIRLALDMHLAVRVHLDLVPDPLSRLTARCDFALLFGDAPVAGPYVTRVMIRTPMRLLASAAYLKRSGAPSVAGLASRRLLCFNPGAVDLETLVTDDGPLPVTPVVQSPDVHLLRNIAAQGGGIAWIPDGPRWLAEESPPLVHILPEVCATVPFRIVAPETMAGSSRFRLMVQRFGDFLRSGVEPTGSR